VLALAEVFVRWRWGLGTPVLFDLDPAIEYVQRPDQHLVRFGNRIDVNGLGMRSRESTPSRATPEEFRVLVLGDSVVNGGALTDQADLATTQLERRLSERLGRPVWVGNVSAGSWGPPNLKAWLDRFGWMDADAVVLVLSSHDATDAPTGTPPDPRQYPTERPLCGLSELVTRYLPGLLADEAPPATVPAYDAAAERVALPALAAILDAARERGTPIGIVQFWNQSEIAIGSPELGHDAISSLADEEDVLRIDAGPIMAALAKGSRRPTGELFRDAIHPSAYGQSVLAQVLVALLEAMKVLPDQG
jgi:lysophospholipase L1-like esterase